MLVATIVNFLVVATASYHGAAYMDSPKFCGRSCHVMKPEYTAYQISPHSHVACVECHIGSGAQAYFNAKVNGTKQLIEVSFHPAGIACAQNHSQLSHADSVAGHQPARCAFTPARPATRPRASTGDKLLVKSSLPTTNKTPSRRRCSCCMWAAKIRSRISVAFTACTSAHIEYIAADPARTTIPWVQRTIPTALSPTFAASALNGAQPQGALRVMDCIDCHNRAAHTFVTPEEAINRAMAGGAISPSLPFIHKEGLALLKATPTVSEDEPASRFLSNFKPFIARRIPPCSPRKPRW